MAVDAATEATVAPQLLVLGPDLTIVQAADVHLRLLELLEGMAGDLQLDLSEIQEFDSAGLQLLLALRVSLRERELGLQLLRPSEVVLAALQCFGLNAELNSVSQRPHPTEEALDDDA